MNNATIIGHIGNDPQITYTDADMAVLRLRVATSTRWVDDEGEEKERTDWHHVTFFGARAVGVAKHVAVGDKIGVSGPIRTRSYTDKKGVQRVRCEIIADKMEFCGKKTAKAPDNEPIDASGRKRREVDDAGAASAAAPKTSRKASRKSEPQAQAGALDDLPF